MSKKKFRQVTVSRDAHDLIYDMFLAGLRFARATTQEERHEFYEELCYRRHDLYLYLSELEAELEIERNTVHRFI